MSKADQKLTEVFSIPADKPTDSTSSSLVCLFVCLFFMWNNGSFCFVLFHRSENLVNESEKERSPGLKCSHSWPLWRAESGPLQCSLTVLSVCGSQHQARPKTASVSQTGGRLRCIFSQLWRKDVTDATFWLILIVFAGLCGTEEEDLSGFKGRILLVCFSTCDLVTLQSYLNSYITDTFLKKGYTI